MERFSMWEFNDIKSIKEIQKLINENKIQEESLTWDDHPLKSKFKSINGSKFNEIESVKIGERNIEYVYFESECERAKLKSSWYDSDENLKPREERINEYYSKIIIFDLDGNVYGIFLSGITTAKRFINHVFNEDNWGEIEEVTWNIDEDFLFWLFKRLKDYSSEDALSSEIDMYLTGLRGYMGKSNDEINSVRGYGKRILAMLGTLSFLFNNDKLKKVRPEVQYDNHYFLIEIALNGTFKMWEEEYQGEFIDLDYNKKKVTILIYLNIILLPKLIQCYKESIDKGAWSAQFKLDFITGLGNEIKDRIEAKLDIIKEEINELEDNSRVE